METKQLRADTYGLLKALVVPLVVLGHIATMYTMDGVYAGTMRMRSDLLTWLSTFLYSFHMPTFFMLSGCVYGFGIRAGKYRRPGQFLLKKSKRLLVPYVLFGVLVVVPVVYFCRLPEPWLWKLGMPEPTVPQAWLWDIGLALQPRHLWYVLVLFEIFVITVPLRSRCEKRPLIVFLFFLAVFVASDLLLPMTRMNYLQYRNLLIYLPFFFFGVLLDRGFDTLRKWTLRLKWFWILLPLAQGCWPMLAYRIPYLKTCFRFLGCIWMLCGAILLCEYLPRLRSCRFLKSLGDCGYGIYLLHPMMIYGIFCFARSWTLHPLLLTAAVFVTVTAVSWLLTLLWHRLVRHKNAQ